MTFDVSNAAHLLRGRQQVEAVSKRVSTTRRFSGRRPRTPRGRTVAPELVFTAWDLDAFVSGSGFDSPSLRWEERRYLFRCEVDAAFFRLCGIARDGVTYTIDTFPNVKRKDEAADRHCRTRDAILATFDALRQASETGESYRTHLDPSPSDPRIAHRPATRSSDCRCASSASRTSGASRGST